MIIISIAIVFASFFLAFRVPLHEALNVCSDPLHLLSGILHVSLQFKVHAYMQKSLGLIYACYMHMYMYTACKHNLVIVDRTRTPVFF